MAALLWLAVAQAHALEVKVGFVNVGIVLEKAPQAALARERIEEEFAPKDRELLAQQKRLRSMEDELIDRAQSLSRAERARQETDIRALKREIRRVQDEFRDDLNLRRSQELSTLQRKVIEVIRSLAKAENYDLIVSDGVIFAGERVDITNAVLARLESEFKQSGN